MLTSDVRAQEGTVVATNHQTAGRGQRGNTWHNSKGKNLAMSVVIYPKFMLPSQQFYLNRMVALAVFDLVKNLLPNEVVKIKWPNDIYVDNRKIAGILIENSLNTNSIAQSIIGIGLNINDDFHQTTLPNAISLCQITQQQYDIQKINQQLIKYLNIRYLQLKQLQWQRLFHDFELHLFRKDEFHPFVYQDTSVTAQITGTTAQGFLLLKTKSDETITAMFQELKYVI